MTAAQPTPHLIDVTTDGFFALLGACAVMVVSNGFVTALALTPPPLF